MTISLLITFYNASIPQIDKCLHSIKNQAVQPCECIVMDDCSKINSDYIKKMCEQFNFAYFRNKTNQGVCISRNILINKCTGEYFAFIDGDDFIEPDYVKKITSQKHDEDIIFFRMKNDNCISKKYKITQNYFLIKSSAACEKCFKTSFIRSNKIYFINGPHLYEDMYFSYKAYFHAKSVDYINDSYLYNYISRSDSASHVVDVKHSIKAVLFYFNKLLNDIHLNYQNKDVQFIYILLISHLVIKAALHRDFESINMAKISIKIMWKHGFKFFFFSAILKLLFKFS